MKSSGVNSLINDLKTTHESSLSREGCLELADYIDELEKENAKLRNSLEAFGSLGLGMSRFVNKLIEK